MELLMIVPFAIIGLIVLFALGFGAFWLVYAMVTGACPNCLEQGHDEAECPQPIDVY